MPINRWMDKDMGYTHTQILLNHRKGWNIAICSNMDGPRNHHTKWSQTEKDKILYDITYMWNEKKKLQVNLFTKQSRLTDIENKLIVIKEEKGGKENIQTTIYKINKDWLCSTGNYIQYLAISYNGEESEKGSVITESLCCTPERNDTSIKMQLHTHLHIYVCVYMFHCDQGKYFHWPRKSTYLSTSD